MFTTNFSTVFQLRLFSRLLLLVPKCIVFRSLLQYPFAIDPACYTPSRIIQLVQYLVPAFFCFHHTSYDSASQQIQLACVPRIIVYRQQLSSHIQIVTGALLYYQSLPAFPAAKSILSLFLVYHILLFMHIGKERQPALFSL